MEELRGFDKVLRHVAGELSQAFIEGEVALPVGKPEMAKVLMVRGYAEMGSVEMLEGRAMTDGTLTLNVCYLCEMGTVQSFESISTFKHTADTPGARPGMKGYALAWSSGVEYNMTDSRRLNVSAVVDVLFQIEDEMQLDAVDAVNLPDDVIARTVEMELFKCVCRASSAIEVEGEVELPDGLPELRSVLCCDGYAMITEAFAEDDSVGLRGDLKLEILYATEDEKMPLCQFFAAIPFSDMIAAPGAGQEHTVNARAKLKHIFARPEEDTDTLHIEAVCTVEVSCEERVHLSAVQDAYSLQYDVNLERSEITSRTRSAGCRGKHAMKDRHPQRGEVTPARVLAATATPSAPRTVASQDGVTIESVLFCQVVFTDAENMLHSEFFELPVRIEEDAGGFVPGQHAQAMVYIDQIQAMFSGGDFEFKVLLSWQAEQFTESKHSIVSSLLCEEEAEHHVNSGIIVCFVDAGDSLWDIAKRYRLHSEDVVRYNPQAQEGINKGDKLILLCRP